MSLEIVRFANHRQLGCPGELYIDGELSAITMEREYNDNKPYISCVPCGTYRLVPHYSERYGEVFILVNPQLNVYALKADRMDDTGRFKCYFTHRGSFSENFQGCVGAGEYYTMIQNRMGINNTRNMTKRINSTVRKEGFKQITIRWKNE